MVVFRGIWTYQVFTHIQGTAHVVSSDGNDCFFRGGCFIDVQIHQQIYTIVPVYPRWTFWSLLSAPFSNDWKDYKSPPEESYEYEGQQVALWVDSHQEVHALAINATQPQYQRSDYYIPITGTRWGDLAAFLLGPSCILGVIGYITYRFKRWYAKESGIRSHS